MTLYFLGIPIEQHFYIIAVGLGLAVLAIAYISYLKGAYDVIRHPVWVGVEVYGLIIQDVHLFANREDAVAWWEEYTEIKYGTLYDENGECIAPDYDETKIFVVDRQ